MNSDYVLADGLPGSDGELYQLRFRGHVPGVGQVIGVNAKDCSGNGHVQISRPGVPFHDVAPVLHGLHNWAFLTGHTMNLSAICEYIEDAGLGCRADHADSQSPLVEFARAL